MKDRGHPKYIFPKNTLKKPTIVFKGEIYHRLRSTTVNCDDVVSVNGIIGWLEFIGEEVIALIDENDVMIKIAIKDIHTIVKYSSFLKHCTYCVEIKDLIGKTNDSYSTKTKKISKSKEIINLLKPKRL